MYLYVVKLLRARKRYIYIYICNAFLLLFIALWVPISAMLFRRAVLVLWHAFLFLGLRFFPLFFFLLGGLRCYFL